ARLRAELLKCNPHARDARLRLLPSSHLSGSFLQHILDGAQLAYHFYVGDASLRALPPEFRETRRIALDDLEQLQQILA
ncbi:MAG TPA: hypothetical protein VKP30_20565, partial [Polyangiaceae bacterium]|nr:hypothetical protein [Polyangiaceae bacterium]